MAAVDPNATYLPLEGLSLGIVVVSLICLVFSVISVGARTYVRLSDGLFGFDDGLVFAGTVAYIADVAVACYAASVGVGTVNAKHNAFMSQEAPKMFTIWILIYVVSLATIKSSICVTLLRIGDTKAALRIAVWVLLFITWASFIVTFVGVLAYCRPIAANWDTSLLLTGEGHCASTEVMIGLSHTATASTIVTDTACVVLPGIILWNIQMKREAKFAVFGLLSFASVASIVTICRAPYISHYAHPTDDLMFWVGHIVLFSNIETAIGCVASSIPTLRIYLMRSRERSQSGLQAPSSNIRSPGDSTSLVTFGSRPNDERRGGIRSRGMFRNPTDTGLSLATVHAKGEWERLQDGDSDKGHSLGENGTHGKGGIRADYTYTVELTQTPRPQT
ncbi:hypothetical protein BJ170DRAFT_183014 [Xylariales sp. AK1849]|nr:hypothetical protein BJ170DRAFT_183014 [Xylariales sp. AK1849]